MSEPIKNKAIVYLVSFNFNEDGDISLAVVGHRNEHGEMDIVNAFNSDIAKELYQTITTRKESDES